MLDLNLLDDRKALLKHFDTSDNKAEGARIERSIFECDIFEGRISEHVEKELIKMYDSATVKEMLTIGDINMAKRVVGQEASIYKDSPKREFTGVTNQDKLLNWYTKTNAKTRLMKANRLYRLQLQTAIYVPLVEGKPQIRTLKNHEYHVFQDDEQGNIFVIPNLKMITGSERQEDDKKRKARYTVWSRDFNFIMNGHGEVVSDGEISNPLDGIIPIIAITQDDEDDYWTSDRRGVADFTRMLNMALSDLMHVMRMQGFSVAAVSGPEDMLKAITTQRIGLNQLLKLPIKTDAEVGSTITSDFKFVTPSPDLAGSISVVETILSSFLSSESIDPKTISMKGESESYSSGWERLLALIEKFDASKEDIDQFMGVEQRYFEIIKKYCSKYNGTQYLDDDFKAGSIDGAELNVTYVKPEIVETQSERGDRLKKEESSGFKSELASFCEFHGVDRKRGLELMKQMEKDKEEVVKIRKPEESTTELTIEDEDENTEED